MNTPLRLMKRKKITIVDYGLGNILSAEQSFAKVISTKGISADVRVSNLPKDIENSTHIVLPGQGAFKSCIDGLKRIDGMIAALEKFALRDKKPFLGICVGMQLLATLSEENGNHEGLNWIKGHIKKLPTKNLKMPHMGWNEVSPCESHPLWQDIPPRSRFYFVHSYHVVPSDSSVVAGTFEYGVTGCAALSRDNLFATQFHPETSHTAGLTLLKNFLNWDGQC